MQHAEKNQRVVVPVRFEYSIVQQIVIRGRHSLLKIRETSLIRSSEPTRRIDMKSTCMLVNKTAVPTDRDRKSNNILLKFFGLHKLIVIHRTSIYINSLMHLNRKRHCCL